MKRRALFICGILFALFSIIAYAEEKLTSLPEKYFKVKLYSERLEFYTDFKDELKKAQKDKLNNGFTTTILARAYLYDVSDPSTPLSISVQESTINYDIWDEIYTVKISAPGSVTSTTTAVQSDAIKTAMTINYNLPLYFEGELSPGSSYLVAVIVEINPLSQELLAETKKWLSRTSGSSAKAGKSSSFFGSFVSIFVNVRQGTAEYTTKFRSLVFSPPKKAQQ